MDTSVKNEMGLEEIKFHEPLYVAVANSKGGVGKSVVTRLLANEFYDLMGWKVLVVDADINQQTIYSHREEEIAEMAEEAQMPLAMAKKQLEESTFKVKRLDPSAIPQAIEDGHMDSYDIIFFDLPGTLSPSIEKVYLMADLILIPTQTTRDDIASTGVFIKFLTAEGSILAKRAELGFKTVTRWFISRGKQSTREFKEFTSYEKDVLPIERMGSFIPDRVDISRYISTIEKDDKHNSIKEINDFVREVHGLIKEANENNK